MTGAAGATAQAGGGATRKAGSVTETSGVTGAAA